MAAGYAMFSNKLGVCFATGGSGTFNLFSGLAVAYSDSIPIIGNFCKGFIDNFNADNPLSMGIVGTQPCIIDAVVDGEVYPPMSISKV